MKAKLINLWEFKVEAERCHQWEKDNEQIVAHQKLILELCSRLNRMDNSPVYAYVLFNGVRKLLKKGVTAELIKKSDSLIHRIVTSGIDLMELERFNQEYLFLGAFVDMKINDSWKELKFYSLVVTALKRIKGQLTVFSSKMKALIRVKYKKAFPEQYFSYFVLMNDTA